MGCDIHTYREKFIDGAWRSADKWTPYDYGGDEKGVSVEYKDRAYTGRDYNLFGLIAKGVRRKFSEALVARGIPFDACHEYNNEVEKWDGDGHSHSYLYLHELRSLSVWLKSKNIPISGMMESSQLAKLHAEMAAPEPIYDSLYPYCQWASDESYVKFEVNIPMSFVIGDGIDSMIASFDGIEGENHRLVFFFDN